MGKFKNKINKLEDQIKAEINRLLNKKGYKSRFSNTRVLHITDERLWYNVENGRFVVELTDKEFIDNEGYRYDLYVLPITEVCEIIDSL